LEFQVLKYVYASVDESLRNFINANGGDNLSADDIIQDAIIVWYEKVKNQEFKLQTTITGYIYTVGKYIWYNKQRKNKRITHNEFQEAAIKDDDFTEQDFELFYIDKTHFVEKLLEESGASCKKILIESIYMKSSMQEIAMANDLKNEQVARNKKSKCLKKLRKIIEATPYFQNVLKYLRT